MDNPSNIHSPQLGKSLSLRLHTLGDSGQTPAGFTQIRLFWAETAREKHPLGNATTIPNEDNREQQKSSERQIPVGLALPRHCPRPGIISRCRKGSEVALRDLTKKGNVLGWAPPCLDLQLF